MKTCRRQTHNWSQREWALTALLLLAWALRIFPLSSNCLHPDEALYGYWGLLIERGRSPWLATVPVYKPPLLPYLIAGGQALFGNSNFVVQLPGLAAGMLMTPLVAALARSLYHDRGTTVVSAISVALSPLAILFSATAFTDPLMVTLGLGACAAAARDRPRWAGALVGLSCAAKQTGLVWLPLTLGFHLIQASDTQAQSSQSTRFSIGRKQRLVSLRSLKRRSLPIVGYFLLPFSLVFVWDGVRVALGAESFWRLGVSGYGGMRLIWPQQLWSRMYNWAKLMRYFFVSPVLNAALLLGLPVLAGRAVTRRRYTRESLVDLYLVYFSLFYLLIHWLGAFPIWDRYLLPLAPVLAILLGRITSLAASRVHLIIPRRSSLLACHLSLVICLAGPAWNATHSRYPVGGDHGVYDGIDQVASFLRDQPVGAVVYQHWLGWHYNYHLFDAPIYQAYWPTPAWLAQDVRVFGVEDARYVVFPSWESSARVERAVADVGYELNPVLITHRRDGSPSFTVYRIQGFGGR